MTNEQKPHLKGLSHNAYHSGTAETVCTYQWKEDGEANQALKCPLLTGNQASRDYEHTSQGFYLFMYRNVIYFELAASGIFLGYRMHGA